MGAVSDSDELAKNRRKTIQNALKDLHPETKERIVKIFETWKGRASEKELEGILGGKRAEKFRKLVGNSADELSSNEVDNLRSLFRESVTFD